MIKVIEHGYMRYYATCYVCHCHFSYELTDLQEGNKVKCPDCGKEHIHTQWSEEDIPQKFQKNPNIYRLKSMRSQLEKISWLLFLSIL